MAYSALVSLANTIDRFLNSNLYSISLEETKQITSLLEHVTPFRQFLDEFPDKFNVLEGRMRDLANEAEDILEYLVSVKVYWTSGKYAFDELYWLTASKEIRSRLEELMDEFPRDFPDEALEVRLRDVAENINRFIKLTEDRQMFKRYNRGRRNLRSFAELELQFNSIYQLKWISSGIYSITEEMMRQLGAAASSSHLAPADQVTEMIGIYDGDQTHDKWRFLPAMFPVKVTPVKKNDEEEEESQSYRSAKHELQLKRVMEEIALVAAQVKEITHSSSSKGVERGGADYSSAFSSSSTAPPTHEDSMVGFEDYVLEIKDRLCGEPSGLQVIPICGMGGIGKTTLARNLYDDPLILSRFDVRVWVTISQDYSAQRILSSIVESLKEFDTGRLGGSKDEKVHKILMGRRYLVVMDDIWSSEAWDIARRVFPDDGNGSRVMLTTRLFDVASYPDASSKLYEMSLLNVDQSWNLFKQKVFADEDCPYELENIGKEITRSCKGLPLAIVVIAGLVSASIRSVASWQEIAQNVKSVETAEHDQIEEILCLSYVQLPQYLRPCFLHMASFPEDEEIRVNKLIKLWVAEGFIESPTDSCFEKVAEECLEKLVKRNLVLVIKRKCDGRIKSCSLHDLLRDLCKRKAHESNFFLNFFLNGTNTDIKEEQFIENIKNQRRVSIDPYLSPSFSRFDGLTIHSIRVSKYKTSIGGLIDLDFVKSVRLLRVLDAEPAQLVHLLSMDQLCELFHLRFLAIRYSGSIPKGLSMLKNLQTLIICGEEFDVGLSGVLRLSWCNPQLRHVYFHGTIYFEDPQPTSSLESLQTLSYVSHLCCTEKILIRLPNLKKLKIDCSEDGARYREDAAWLNDLVHLDRLENLEVDAGPWFQSRPKHYKIAYPSMLKKLTLRDLRLPWSNILVVGSLPNLQVLKLKRCTCVGGTWETTEGAFPVLEVLLIRRSSFKYWITGSSHFPRLQRLLIDSCRDLNGIPSDIGEIPTLELIEVKGQEVKKSLVESVEQIQQEQEELANDTLQVICIAK